MYRFYNLLLILLSPLLAIFLMIRLAKGKSRIGWSQRWGKVDAFDAPNGGKRVWVHAASVGEVMAATPILEAYRTLRPSDKVLMSVITPGGHEVATAQIGKTLDAVIFAPFDVPIAVKRAIRQIRPDLYVNMETEIWPNMLALQRKRGAKLVLVNGRISDKSIVSYQKFAWLFRWALSHFHQILTQSDLDSSRYIKIGANPNCVETIGNSKFDQAPESLHADQVMALKRELKIAPKAPIWVVGSTRGIEEERVIWQAYLKVCAQFPNLILIHAPRHIDRATEMHAEMQALGMKPNLRTEINSEIKPSHQIILNTFGELSSIYGIADIVFIGNSLTPPGGGQNILQPLAHGKMTLFGPFMQNFKDVVNLAKQTGSVQKVEDENTLAAAILKILSNPESALATGLEAQEMIAANRGVAEKYAQRMVHLIGNGPNA